jgi:hypothetical protein
MARPAPRFTPMAGRLRYRLFEPPGAQTSMPRNYRYFNESLIEVTTTTWRTG